MQDFAKLLLHKDPSCRPSAKEALLLPTLLPAVKAMVTVNQFTQAIKEAHEQTRAIREMRKYTLTDGL